MKNKALYDRISAEFCAYLKGNGMALTVQRKNLLLHILEGPPHFDIEEMSGRVRAENAGISRATIYRTINHMEKAGIVRKMDFDENHAHFEITSNSNHHEHLVCVKCGSIVEFSDDTLEKRIEAMAGNHGFSITSHNVQISGICNKCIKQNKENRKVAQA
jgi:Fur family ferric uptake transcriptional regulator